MTERLLHEEIAATPAKAHKPASNCETAYDLESRGNPGVDAPSSPMSDYAKTGCCETDAGGKAA
jgi:hypothetical protein